MSHEINIPEWKTDYEIGVNEIDFQHKYFLALINRFYLSVNSDTQKELVTNHLNEIILYAQFHFCSEENIMRLYNYPEYQQHKLKHVEIIQVLSNKLGLFELNELSINEIVLFMINWFLEHTAKEDTKLTPFIKK